ncbi:MAG: M6 family metalloprotease domain-containing protein [Candidatus Wallbacteria bacterium]|nr:M6 family metalloprotease domain-containing protein [Candidatus Wallbacteria bacterium]
MSLVFRLSLIFLLVFYFPLFADNFLAPPNPDAYPEFYHSELRTKRAPLKFPNHAPKMNAFASQAPQTGECVILVVPFGFTDKLMTDTIIQDLNQKETSFVAYYDAVSHGKLQVTFVNAPIVTSSHTYAWYAADSVSNTDDYNGNIYELAREAIDKLKAQSYSFNKSLLDKNNDGILDHLMIVHSGNAQEATRNASDIWSNRWEIQNPSGPQGEIISTGFKAQNYTMQAQSSPVGILCHEFGHDLGLPDLYNTTNGNSVVGRWCLMDGGAWNGISTNDGSSPAYLSAWCRYFLGWCDLTDISAWAGSFSLTPIESTTDPVFRAAITGTEYFLLENRQQTGYDSGTPGKGMLVWHVDEQILATQWDSGINSNSSHYGISIVEGDWTSGSHLGMGGDEGTAADVFPGSLNKTVFNTTLPSSGANSSSFYAISSYVSLSSIQTSGSSINFTNNYSGPKAIARITLNPASAIVSYGAIYNLSAVTMTAVYSDSTTGNVAGTWKVKSGNGSLSGNTYTSSTNAETAVLTCSYKETSSGYTKISDFSISPGLSLLSSITFNPTIETVSTERILNLESIEVTVHYISGSSKTTTSELWSIISGSGNINDGKYIADPNTAGTVELNCSYTESSETVTAILSVNVPVLPISSITLSSNTLETFTGSNLNLGNIVPTAHYENGVSRNVNGIWSVKSGGGSINGSNFTAPTASGTVELSCTYTENGVTNSTNLVINVKRALSSFSFNPSSYIMYAGDPLFLESIEVIAHYTNGTTGEVLNPIWSIHQGQGTIENGVYTAGYSAGYTYLSLIHTEFGDTTSVTFTVSIIRKLTSISVSVTELTLEISSVMVMSTLTSVAHYINGSTQEVTPTWEKISGNGMLSGGLFSALSFQGSALLRGTYSDNGITRTIDLPVKIFVPVSGITLSPTLVLAGINQGYDMSKVRITATYYDATIRNVTGEIWSIKSGGGSINGDYYQAPLQTGEANLLCTYSECGYTRTAELRITTVGDRYEPDNDCAHTTLLSSGSPQTDHSLTPGTDEDWYRIVLPETSNIVLETSGDSGGDTVILLYSNTSAPAILSNDDYGVTKYSRIQRAGLVAGTYYVQVKNFGNTLINSYTMNFQATIPQVTANIPPQIASLNHSGTSGAIRLNYSLIDANSDPCSFKVQFSLNAGDTWNDCTKGDTGESKYQLSSSSSGVSHLFIWNSVIDFKTDQNSVEIRACANDGTVDGLYAYYSLGLVNNQPQLAYNLSGQVSGVSSARVTVWNKSLKVAETTLGTNGSYNLTLGRGTYTLMVYATDYYPGTTEVTITSSEVTSLNIELIALPTLTISNIAMFAYGEALIDHDGDGMTESAEPGDVIEARDINGQICGLFQVKEAGLYGSMPIYGDDITTSSIDEGFTDGETVYFYINRIRTAITTTFADRAFNKLDQLAAGKDLIAAGAVQLRAGWNLISLGVQPSSQSIEVIFSNVPEMKYVMGFFRNPADNGAEGFRTYMNIESVKNFSTLTTMDGFHGYWVYMTGEATLSVDGALIGKNTIRELSSGWNLVGYWNDASGALPSLETQTGTVIDSIYNNSAISGICKYIMGFYRTTDDGGSEGFRTFMNNSAMSFSTLKNLDACHGYWLYMNNPGIIKYSGDNSPVENISFTPNSIDLNADSTYDLTNILVNASCANGSSALLHFINWKIKSGSGAIDGNTFTAPSESGTTILTGTFYQSGMNVSTDLQIRVINGTIETVDFSGIANNTFLTQTDVTGFYCYIQDKTGHRQNIAYGNPTFQDSTTGRFTACVISSPDYNNLPRVYIFKYVLNSVNKMMLNVAPHINNGEIVSMTPATTIAALNLLNTGTGMTGTDLKNETSIDGLISQIGTKLDGSNFNATTITPVVVAEAQATVAMRFGFSDCDLNCATTANVATGFGDICGLNRLTNDVLVNEIIKIANPSIALNLSIITSNASIETTIYGLGQ